MDDSLPKEIVAQILSVSSANTLNNLKKTKNDMKNNDLRISRDVSYVYDTPGKPLPYSHIEKSKKSNDASTIRAEHMRHKIENKKNQIEMEISQIPKQSKVIKDENTFGLEFDGEEPEDEKEIRDKMIIFPNNYPKTRKEVLLLASFLNEQLKNLGNPHDQFDVFQLTNADQIEDLIKLIIDASEIFQTVFHEVCRQVATECPERAEILMKIREKYKILVDLLPAQLKRLKTEASDQKKLDEALTKELFYFKNSIEVLTAELAEVRSHDAKVTQEAENIKQELNLAIKDQQNSADLLKEFHNLYELQRKRLDTQISQLNFQKEEWSSMAYCVALKISNEASISTAKRMHMIEKNVTQLNQHFAFFVADQNTKLLTEQQDLLQKWQTLSNEVHTNLFQCEYRRSKMIHLVDDKTKEIKEILNKKFSNTNEYIRAFKDMMENLDEILNENEYYDFFNEIYLANQIRKQEDQLNTMRASILNAKLITDKIYERHSFLLESLDQENRILSDYYEQAEEFSSEFAERSIQLRVFCRYVTSLIKIFNDSIKLCDKQLEGSIQNNMGEDTIELNIESAQESIKLLLGGFENWINGIIGQSELVDVDENENDRRLIALTRNFQNTSMRFLKIIEAYDSHLLIEIDNCHSTMADWMIESLFLLVNLQQFNKESDITDLEEKVNKFSGQMEIIFKQNQSFNHLIMHLSNHAISCLQEQEKASDISAMLDLSRELDELKKLEVEIGNWRKSAEYLNQDIKKQLNKTLNIYNEYQKEKFVQEHMNPDDLMNFQVPKEIENSYEGFLAIANLKENLIDAENRFENALQRKKMVDQKIPESRQILFELEAELREAMKELQDLQPIQAPNKTTPEEVISENRQKQQDDSKFSSTSKQNQKATQNQKLKRRR